MKLNGRRGWLDAYDAIPITDHITRYLAPAESFNQLLRDPFCGRMGGYSQPQKFPTGMLQN
jgi:hypothetical protein